MVQTYTELGILHNPPASRQVFVREEDYNEVVGVNKKYEVALRAITALFDDEDFMDELTDVFKIIEIAEAALK